MDNNYQSFWKTNGEHITASTWVPPVEPSQYSDVLKFSDCSKTLVEGIALTGKPPLENWIDAVRGSDYRFKDCTIGAAPIAGATLKGGIDGWAFMFCTFSKSPVCEIELGQFDDYWFPGRKPTRHGAITRCKRSDGGKVRVICWDADEPLYSSLEVEVRKVPKLIWFPYFLFRFCWIRVKKLFKHK